MKVEALISEMEEEKNTEKKKKTKKIKKESGNLRSE